VNRGRETCLIGILGFFCGVITFLGGNSVVAV
jgi:hypothetical protein